MLDHSDLLHLHPLHLDPPVSRCLVQQVLKLRKWDMRYAIWDMRNKVWDRMSGWKLPAWPPQCCLYHLKSRASFLCPKYFWAKFVPTTYNEQCKIKWCSALGAVLSAMVSVLYIGHTNDRVGHSVVNNGIHWEKESFYRGGSGKSAHSRCDSPPPWFLIDKIEFKSRPSLC